MLCCKLWPSMPRNVYHHMITFLNHVNETNNTRNCLKKSKTPICTPGWKEALGVTCDGLSDIENFIRSTVGHFGQSTDLNLHKWY